MVYDCRYIMLAKMSDSSGEAWISAFNEQAESLLGQRAEDLAKIRNQVSHLLPSFCSPERLHAFCYNVDLPIVFVALRCYVCHTSFQHLYNGICGAQDGDGKPYEAALRQAMWVPHIYRISVAQTEYMNEKRQRVTVRSVGPVDWAAESRHLLENIAKVR